MKDNNMNATNETQSVELTESEKLQTAIQERFDAQEKKFAEQEKEIADMRAWLLRNRERIAPFIFCTSGRTICFYSFIRTEGQQKDIAKAFGKDGWKREKDSHTCGALHWFKEFDGVTLKIHEAEIVKFNPIDEVKL